MEEEENIWKRKIFARQEKKNRGGNYLEKKIFECGGQEERRGKGKKIFEGDKMTG